MDTLEINNLPSSIKNLINGKPYMVDSFGKSGSGVFVFDDCVLKIVDARNKLIREHNETSVQVMRWLEGKLSVPKVICYEADNNFQYLLMTRISGKMSCDEYYLEHPDEREKIAGYGQKIVQQLLQGQA